MIIFMVAVFQCYIHAEKRAPVSQQDYAYIRACITDTPIAIIIITMSQISSKDLAAKVGLRADALTKPCESCLFPSVANFINPWRVIFSSLLNEVDLSDIDTENHSEQEKRIAALRKWKARNGNGATYEVLVKTVLDSGEKGQAECMCQYLADQLSHSRQGEYI